MSRQQGNWMSTELRDMRGREFIVTDKVVRACTSGRAVNLELATVTRIDDGKLYLDSSKVPINYPGRMLIVSELFAQ